MKSVKKISDIICYHMKPVHIGRETKGYFMDTENFKKLLEAIIEEEEHENNMEIHVGSKDSANN